MPQVANIDAQRWRERIHRLGENFRWFPAQLCGCEDYRVCELCERDGRIYTERVLPSGAKAWFAQTEVDIESTEFNVLFPKGSSQITVMPDECWPQRLDRIVASDQEQPSREIVLRNTITDDDDLVHGYVVSVQSVRQGAEIYTQYVLDPETLEATGDFEILSQGIRWRSNHRPLENTKYAVEYRYQPMFYFLMPITLPFKDSYGVLMPMDGILTEKLPTDGD